MLGFNTDFRETHNRDLFDTDSLRRFSSKINQYSDEQEEVQNGKKMAVLTIRRNQTALVRSTNKMNRLVCTLIDGSKFELGLDETAVIRVEHGPNKITFDFWGQSLVPAKCRATPDFVVDGDMYIELTPDATWGGFKTQFSK